jgi:hypothetical protein
MLLPVVFPCRIQMIDIWCRDSIVADHQTLTLRDNRVLSYAEYGDPTGLPLIGFHGMPGSRNVLKSVDEAARAAGVHLIAPERPGYGFSQPHPHRTLPSYTKELQHALDNQSGLASSGRELSVKQ